jgi:hypothetical protein
MATNEEKIALVEEGEASIDEQILEKQNAIIALEAAIVNESIIAVQYQDDINLLNLEIMGLQAKKVVADEIIIDYSV